MKRVERTKMLRRLEKLIDLHFPSDSEQSSPAAVARHVQRPQERRRASSFFDLDFRNMNISDAGGLLRGVVGGGDLHDMRVAEQRITPWQNDANVNKCPLCSTSFHPLTNRKHHCRLCGQIICSLPVKHPHRPVTCSLLFVVDPRTRRIEEVDEGVDYGVRRKPLDNANGASHKTTEDKFLKGVRICRSCRPILLRQQYQYEFTHVPLFSKLYEAFIALEQEIEESLPQFQELILSLSHNDQPTQEASISRKRLLEAFAQYDALAKRIRALPCRTGSSADQVQSSIMNRASLFLQKNMFPLQSLPKPKKPNTKTTTISNDDGPKVDPDSEMAMALQPLLEQEALLESFVEEAKAHRKFEDVKTLKTNLQEIRMEIDRIVVNADAGLLHGNNGKAH
ncbi:Vacuolar segregation protein PEP7 [Termitomyces sp. J132]|nr:Vacuolar segregation protein PEP7 [Termitomyces sp. J132]